MKRFSFIIFLWVTFLSLASAQHLSRHYHNRSMSDVLIDLVVLHQLQHQVEIADIALNERIDDCCSVCRSRWDGTS